MEHDQNTVSTSWKELGSTTVALAVVAVTLTLLYQTFSGAPDAATRKDVLLIAVSLLGTVTGYYFGRIPSELRAQAAEQAGRKAEDRELRMRAAARESLDAALGALRGSLTDGARSNEDPRAALARLEALRGIL